MSTCIVRCGREPSRGSSEYAAGPSIAATGIGVSLPERVCGQSPNLSAEFLMGPHLGNKLINLGVLPEAQQAMAKLGLDLDGLLAAEVEPGLASAGICRSPPPTALAGFMWRRWWTPLQRPIPA